tara:strand:- start:366 stop:578 length:213 start_codon:yes stop_codon:yes gene_type:complete
MQAYQARRRQRNVKDLLIQPELEEIAKYGAKIPQWPEQEELSLLSTNGIKATGFQPVRFSVMYYNLPSHF